MITGPLKSKIDKLWEEFWTGGITNPLTVIEQISFLMFARMLDLRETNAEKKFARNNRGKKFKGELFKQSQQHLRWQNFRHEGDAEEMLKIVRDELFPHMRELADRSKTFSALMKDAGLVVQKPSLLSSAVSLIDELPLAGGDTKGDLYEYLLSKLTTAGINGQFRTPRHIIRKMVELLDPKVGEKVADPSCGTAGFLVGATQYVMEMNTSEDGVIEEEVDGEIQRTYTGDKLTKAERAAHQRSLYGFDFDTTMLRIASMNLMLHGLEDPDVLYQDTLSTSFPDRYGELAKDSFDVILANPPFKGSLDASDVHPSLTGIVKTKKTEILFLALILRMLKSPGGRAATVVPDGVLFGSSKAHKAIRKTLVEENQLDAVISLPSGVFKPYAGVSTAILVFTKGGQTDNVFFYDVQADGYSLDDKRTEVKEDDLPEMLKRWTGGDPKKDIDRTSKSFFVARPEIEATDYDLSMGRYQEHLYEEQEFAAPSDIVKRLRILNASIDDDLSELKQLLGGK